MEKYLKSRFFLTKVLPALYFSIFGLWHIYGILFGKSELGLRVDGIILIAIVAIVLFNLHMRQYWLSCIVGSICTLIFFYLIFALLSEYSEFPNLASFEALRLLFVGLLLCISGMTVGILLIIPFKPMKQEQV